MELLIAAYNDPIIILILWEYTQVTKVISHDPYLYPVMLVSDLVDLLSLPPVKSNQIQKFQKITIIIGKLLKNCLKGTLPLIIGLMFGTTSRLVTSTVMYNFLCFFRIY